ncbi:MAG: sigma-70 family RNA polymerase sigma factor [bacterium]|nr:sigma-70 family RNA polymerase sigma factor [bacterium]
MSQDESVVDDATEAYRAHRHELMRFATALVGPRDAADLFSTAVVKALASPTFATADNKRAYLYRIIFNEAHRFRARRSRRPAIEAAGSTNQDWRMPALHPEVAAAVRSLSSRQRAVVFLAYWADMTPAQIAEHLHISDGSVRRHLARARARLREVLDERHTR